MSSDKKILSLKELLKKISSLKKKNKKIVLCHGVFDILHIGHIKHFESAKKNGDILVVTVTKDKYVNKGTHRPTFKINDRLLALASLNCVDFVSQNDWPTAINTIKFLKPHFYCKGSDYKQSKEDITNQIKNEINAIKSVGGKILYTNEDTFSSSKIFNNYSVYFTDSQKTFLKKIFKKYNFSEIKKIIDKINNLKVLVIGETIIDEYIFSEALGKSGKEPVITLRELHREKYLGGSSSIANHISSFCKEIKLISMVGQNKENLSFIKKRTKKNVKNQFIYKENSPTILKKRYIDFSSHKKIIGVYDLNDEQLSIRNKNQLIKKINQNIKQSDVIIVADYGHGFISNDIAKTITNKSKFLAANAQINSSNMGYHTLNKYKNIDCLIVNETELRHEMRDKESDLKQLMIKLSNKNKIKKLIITQGSIGVTLYDLYNKKFSHCPAFASNVVDIVGAGDAMLSIISLCVKEKIDNNIALYLGSLAASQSVESLGNSIFVNKNDLLKTIKYSII
tara:strand:- start:2144 stop:3673 length:1530 start_codon:yes stop_codon:yes gene_type:complete